VIAVVIVSVLDLLAELGDLFVCWMQRFFEVALEPSAETACDLLKDNDQRGYSCD
jgi:hypothetical protein